MTWLQFIHSTSPEARQAAFGDWRSLLIALAFGAVVMSIGANGYANGLSQQAVEPVPVSPLWASIPFAENR